MNGKKCFMTIERCLSPPHLNPREQIYCGEEIELTGIPKKLGLEPGVAGNYLYTVSKIERKGKQLEISQGVFDYEELQKGYRKDQRAFGLTHSIPLSLEVKVIEQFKDLLEE